MLVLATPAIAIQTGTLSDEGYAQFFRGELRNLSLSQQGELESAPRLAELARLTQPVVWTAVPDGRGNLILGTGNRGEVVRLGPEGETETLFTPDKVLTRALAVASDGSILVGTSPDGVIHRLPPDGGRAERLVQLPDTYIWAFVLEEDALWVATGLSARLYRVPLKKDFSEVGDPELWLETGDNHFTALARDGDRWLIGASGRGIVYELKERNKAFALANVDEEEIRSLQVAEDGTIWFSAYTHGSEGSGSPAERSNSPTPSGDLPPFVVTAEGPGSGGSSGSRPSGRGILYRIETNGFVTSIWRSTRSGIFSLEALNPDYWLGGTNDEGKLFYFADRNDWGLLHQLPRGGEIGVIVRAPDGDGFYVISSNPGVVYRLGGVGDEDSVFTSRVLDARQPVEWGGLELSLAEEGPLNISTRTGNTSSVDATWSEWMALEAGKSQSPTARFIQYKVEIPGESPARLLRTRIFYRMPNVPPQILAIRVLNFGVDLQSVQVPQQTFDFSAAFRDNQLGADSGGGEERLKLSRRPEQTLRTVVWRAQDPNGDPLSFDLSIRKVGEDDWTLLARDLRDPVYTFNAAGMAPGHYQIRLSASDHRANPPERAQRVSRVSEIVLIDTTPPKVEVLEAASGPQQIVVRVDSQFSRLVAAQYRIDGDEPIRLRPRDGIFDQQVEEFVLSLPEDLPDGTSIVFDVLDESGNQTMHAIRYRRP